MASNFCTYIPSKGATLFKKLRKQFDYQTAVDIFLRAINPAFINDYKETLSLDAEGIPTYESVMDNSFIKQFLGKDKILDSLNKEYHPIEDTRDNYSNLLESAKSFNTTSKQREEYVATVEKVDEDHIKVVIHNKTEEAVKRFNEQYGTLKLNNKLISIFAPLGLTIDHLTNEEVKAGRLGITDFSIARNIATGFASMIRVANNMMGSGALTEEFAHILVGLFRKDILVQRALRVLENNPNAMMEILGDTYEDTVQFFNGDMSLVAEEALGHILQKNLLNNHNKLKTPSPSLFDRVINWIRNKFIGYDIKDVTTAIDYADTAMNQLAADILSGTREITKEDLAGTQRNAKFNALNTKIERNINILKQAINTEAKRYKIAKSETIKDMAEKEITDLNPYTYSDTADTALGIFNYAKYALQELHNIDLQFSVIDNYSPEQKFAFLRRARAYIQSFGGFIQSLNDALISDESDEDSMFIREFQFGEDTTTLREVLRDLNDLTKKTTRNYAKTAMPAFAKFLEPFFGKEITIPFGKHAGTTLTVESLLTKAESDISFMDRWLDSMADSADTLLQIIDSVVNKAKGRARLHTMDDIRDIQKLRKKAESLGITSFEWMFEKDSDGHKSGNYIGEINYAQFEKDLADFNEYLNNKYGINPRGSKATEKIEERTEWLRNHATSIWGKPTPNPMVYRNKEYFALSSNQKQILDEFLNIKSRLDAKLPESRVATLKAIQIRKKASQRLLDSITDPETLFNNISEAVSSSLLDKEDDDQLFGNSSVDKGLMDFEGREYMTLPVLYTTRLANADELSTDVMGSLMAYSYMANQYEELDKIIDPLEVGRTLISTERKYNKTRGDKSVKEQFKVLGVSINNDINMETSNIEAKLQDYFESQIYGRYLKDEGTILGTKVNTNKLVSLILKGSSLAQLGCNWLANIANVTTGLGMQNIEAASRQFFTPKSLAKADGIFFKYLMPMMSELGSRNKTNKMALFFELFDVKQDFGKHVKRNQTKNLLRRLFGIDIAFLGQEVGDYWLYGRAAVAMALEEQVKLNGVEMNLWDALQVIGDDVKSLNYKAITDLRGNPFDVIQFSRKVAHINQVCFGIYNDEDANAANRVALGRLLQQYRKWMKIQYNRRFQAVQTNLMTNTLEEGYYRTGYRLAANILRELKRGEFQIVSQFKNLTFEERANIWRCLTEIVQFLVVWGLANWVEWPDDKKRPYALKLLEYMAKRLAHELGGLTPSTVMPQELLKTVQSPIPALNVIQNTFNFVNSLMDPSDWNNEISSGPYKGLSTLEKNTIKAPIPIVAQYRQIDKFIDNLDDSIIYYTRSGN